ncbi:TraM recognition domain-containing protein [Nonomuraea sp. K274]|uniref:TraM recognition domain-containing protein n=1 Tax=Nonomuraea cypriaca TaxID=1187855 RepID=A0A931AHH7_9ACTN|nr:TraM recognition domain-containing protein [Nonomuraea cypriaca]MBF8190578.1 TraM recognition domain-containing protein [Nonomuraea cypriaca]
MIHDLLKDPDAVLDQVLDWLTAYYWQILALVIGVEMFGVLLHAGAVQLRHRSLLRGARCVEILAPPVANLPGAEALWGNLIGLLRPSWKRLVFGQPHLAFEYSFGAGGVKIALWVPGSVPQHLVEHAIEAAWPSSRTAIHKADPPVPIDGYATGGQLLLARAERLPIRHHHSGDPLRALLGAAVGMPGWQHACVQVLARPATGRRLISVWGGATARLVRALLDLLVPGPRHVGRPTGDRVARLEETAEAQAIRDKAHHSRYEVAIRYAVQADEPTPADLAAAKAVHEIRRNAIRGRAHALASAFALFSGHNRLERRRLFRPAERLAVRRMSRGYLLSVPELSAIAHLPLDAAVPGLQRAGANTVPPSPKIDHGGPHAKVLGFSDAGHDRPVALRVADSFHHVHVMGPNGTGKSTLLAQLILSDIEAGRGVVVIEAKGDLVLDLLGLIPEDRAAKVVLVDPDDQHARPSLNVLGGPDLAMGVDNLVGIFHQIYADYWGPRTDDILRGCALTLARNGGTLADIPTLLSDTAFRRRQIATIGDPLLRGFWTWYSALSEAAQANVTAPIMNKLRAFLLRPFVRDVLGSASSTFDLGEVLDGGILLVRLPKGVLGDDSARLLGSMILAQVWQTASRRAKFGHARHPAALYVDECHNFLTLPHALSDMLAEARAYRVSLTLAHQHLAQLPRQLRQAISSDARNKIYFSLSPEDAREVEHHFAPFLTAHDLANFDAFQAAARLVVRSAEAPPFTLRTRPLPQPSRDVAKRIRAAAAQAHGRTAATTTPKPDVRRTH